MRLRANAGGMGRGRGHVLAGWAAAMAMNGCVVPSGRPDGELTAGDAMETDAKVDVDATATTGHPMPGDASGPGSGSSETSHGDDTSDHETASATATTGPSGTTASSETSTSGAPSEATDTGDVCADLEVVLTPQVPNVVLLLDQSGSMTTSFASSDRWDTVDDVLFNGTDGVVFQLENKVRFGMALYTSHNGNSGGTCPILTEVALGVGNYAALASAYDTANPDDETPTAESVDAVAAELIADTEPGAKVIVLATDGEPDTCAEPNPQNGQDEAVASVTSAYELGVQTFIISVGNEVSAGHMQDMANAGAGVVMGEPDATYYQALDKAALVAAFDEIINGVRDCVFTLNGEVQMGFEHTGTVLVDNVEKTYLDPNGWRLNSPTELELLGTTCTAIQSGDVEIDVTFPCGAIVPQ